MRVEPTFKQIEPVSTDSVYAIFPDAQVDWVTGVAGGTDWPPSDTVRLTGAPDATDAPADGFEPITVPAGIRESAIPESTCGERPASLRALMAASWLEPMMFGMTTECLGAVEVAQAETVSPTHRSATAPSRPVNPISPCQTYRSFQTSPGAAVLRVIGAPTCAPEPVPMG
jgi:hypothetical protein